MLRRNPDNYVKFFPTASAPKIDVHGKLTVRGCLELPSIADNGLRIASLTDLLAQKLMAMAERDAQRDALDVTALIRDGRAELEFAISAACDETGYGLGEDCADRLGLKLLDTEVMPWQESPELKLLREALTSVRVEPIRQASANIQGPADLRTAVRTVRVRKGNNEMER